MTENELFESVNRIEIREGKERTVKSYVLRNNVLSDKARRVIGAYMEKYGLFFRDEILDYHSVFGNDNPTVIEIGFGMGDTTAEIALRRPECNYIGIEVFLQGFVRLHRDRRFPFAAVLDAHVVLQRRPARKKGGDRQKGGKPNGPH